MQTTVPGSNTIPAEQTETQKQRAAIEALEPTRPANAMPVQRVFQWTLPNGNAVQKAYVQAELGLFPAQDFGLLVTEIVESFTKGDMGMKIGDLFRGQIDMPSQFTGEAVNTLVDENMALVQAFVKLIQTVPSLQLNILCLSLGVPRLEREWAKSQMQEPPHRGGLSVDDGFELLSTFISQNAVLLRETFVGKAKELVEQFQMEVLQMEPANSSPSTDSTESSELQPQEDEPSPGSTPSSTSSLPIPESV